MPRVYPDTCIVIYLIEGSTEVQEVVRSAFDTPEGDSITLCYSDLTRLECRVGPLQREDEDLLGLFDLFFTSSDTERVPLTTEVFDLAAELRAKYRLKTPDAIHLAAALRAECEELWTNDRRFSNAAGDSLQIKVLP
jgi:predicted nucleic acid-binding protein